MAEMYRYARSATHSTETGASDRRALHDRQYENHGAGVAARFNRLHVLPRIDSPTIFAGLLEPSRGGAFSSIGAAYQLDRNLDRVHIPWT
ncbi:hypothetical protein [Paraburkholderia sp. RL17-337-BIB-A]|uniref:hypothetical protein n=1 Tax=Paraburkholderia sp. RL17-337-BIB-A TaxID=3031636 RepID=UPI0038BA5E4C